ncbi:hypothetical protein CSV86_003440 [Pseudomonas putida CSV86]|uniref:Uncharacterized protein n=1 Tax=Pseudomonas bharatica CSV86 TaxID=1005395 RepID=L1LSZ3_9PSED|nr:hypothetical protein [Pseudomonas bharatica]NNJ14375.1 hypothetical protein [Pseudomonas bharatica CSV86]
MIYVLLFAIMVFVKIIVFTIFIVSPQKLFSGGNDGDYYDAYARGADLVTSSIWPDVLRSLNSIGLYSREGVSFFMMLLGVIAIPLLVGRLALVRGAAADRKVCLLLVLGVSCYPTLFYCTMDIYRDVLMLFVFLVGLALVRSSLESPQQINRWMSALAILMLSYVMFLLRGYLGFAFAVSFITFRFVRFRKLPLLVYVLPILVALNVLFALGYLQPLMKYRELFNALQGGSDLGIRFESIYTFVPEFIHSFAGQMLGLFYPNLTAILIFLVESFPFFAALVYLVRNRRFSNRFVDFIFVFFIVYSIIWLLGNDNLGTAARLRMYNYLGVLIAFAIVYQRKKYAECVWAQDRALSG